MPKETTIFDPERVVPSLKKAGGVVRSFFSSKKRIAIAIIFILVISLFGIRTVLKKNGTATAKSVSQSVNKNYDFTALDNQGKPLPAYKIKFTISSVEKTNQVLVKDQIFTARNNKTFLIVHIGLKNDATVPVNSVPGDLVRLVVESDTENKFAPDLHNNLVYVAAISTKEDRIGFVIPEDAKSFTLTIGELTGKKEEVSVKLPS